MPFSPCVYGIMGPSQGKGYRLGVCVCVCVCVSLSALGFWRLQHVRGSDGYGYMHRSNSLYMHADTGNSINSETA